jgi:hypothetical protein
MKESPGSGLSFLLGLYSGTSVFCGLTSLPWRRHKKYHRCGWYLIIVRNVRPLPELCLLKNLDLLNGVLLDLAEANR